MLMRNSRLHKLEEQVSSLQTQLDSIARHLGIVPNPPRHRWQRYSSPIDRMSIDTKPTEILPALEITRITIDQHSFVRSYHGVRELEKYSGPLASVINWLPARTPHIKEWRQVRTWEPENAPDTPIPEVNRNLV